jgi:serine/threonine-protein kinase RsbW
VLGNQFRAPEPRRAKSDEVVVLTLPASSAYLSVLRTATAGLAARLRFTLDEIEDLRIAVDEACAMLLVGVERDLRDHRRADPDADPVELRCLFGLGEDRITVEVSVPATEPVPPSRDTFAWTVLTALAGEVDAVADRDRLTIRLTKQRSRVR